MCHHLSLRTPLPLKTSSRNDCTIQSQYSTFESNAKVTKNSETNIANKITRLKESHNKWRSKVLGIIRITQSQSAEHS